MEVACRKWTVAPMHHKHAHRPSSKQESWPPDKEGSSQVDQDQPFSGSDNASWNYIARPSHWQEPHSGTRKCRHQVVQLFPYYSWFSVCVSLCVMCACGLADSSKQILVTNLVNSFCCLELLKKRLVYTVAINTLVVLPTGPSAQYGPLCVVWGGEVIEIGLEEH